MNSKSKQKNKRQPNIRSDFFKMRIDDQIAIAKFFVLMSHRKTIALAVLSRLRDGCCSRYEFWEEIEIQYQLLEQGKSTVKVVK